MNARGMDDILDSDLAQAGGYLTWISTITMTLLEWASSLEVNDILQALTALGSLLFLYYKVQNLRLDKKIKEKELKKDARNEGK
jgi:hypothetical protein